MIGSPATLRRVDRARVEVLDDVRRDRRGEHETPDYGNARKQPETPTPCLRGLPAWSTAPRARSSRLGICGMFGNRHPADTGGAELLQDGFRTRFAVSTLAG